MKKYKCSQKKEEIITIISEEFAKVLKDLEADHSPENYGRYHAYIDLLQRVKIYEVENWLPGEPQNKVALIFYFRYKINVDIYIK